MGSPDRCSLAFLASLALVASQLFPCTATAGEDSPVELRPVLLDADRLRAGDVGLVDLEVLSQIDVDSARIGIAIPEGMRSDASRVVVARRIDAGERSHVFATVAIAEPGEHTIRCEVRAPGFSHRVDLNVLVTGDGVVVATTDPWDLVRFRRARTDEERAALLETSLVPVEIAPEDRPRPDPALDAAMADILGNTGEEPDENRHDAIARWVDVHGYIYYRDSTSALHPMRYVLVEVVDDDSPGPDQILGRAVTRSDGSYSARAWVPADVDPTGDVDLKVRFVSQIANGRLAIVTIDGTRQWVTMSAPVTDFTGASHDFGNLATPAPVPGSVNDDPGPRVFSVVDCMLQMGVESYFLRNRHALPTLDVRYPVGGAVSFYCDPLPSAPDCATPTCAAPVLNVLRFDALDWDILGHEWGHYLASRGTTRHIDTSCGGSHSSLTSTIPANGKSSGIRIAWSEGLATFLCIAMQEQNSIALPSIPNAGDTKYDDTEDQTLSYDLETPDATRPGLGYANEASVMRVLWDLHDRVGDVSPDSDARDGAHGSLKKLWSLITAADNSTLPKLWEYLEGRSPNVPTSLILGSIFAMNNVGPEIVAPVENAVLSSAVPPQFSWMANGDPTAGFQNNAFTLAVTRDGWQSFSTFDAGAGTTFTPPEAGWRAIFTGADETTQFQWCVLGRNTAAPATPAGAGTFDGSFPSNAHRFKARSIELRLTWSPVGADVDLHLRPPSGFSSDAYDYADDCAYYNRTPDWGVAGDASDDPALDRDCITDCAEENITVARLTEPGRYRVIAHYFNDHGHGDASVTIELRQFGRLIQSASTTLHNVGGSPSSGDVWTAFTISSNP